MPSFIPNQADILISNIGSFWSNVFSDYDKLATITSAGLDLYSQTELDQLDLLASISRFEIPVFKHENWVLFTPSALEIEAANKKLYVLDGEISLGDAVNLGDTKLIDNWELSINSDLADISYIVDSPSNPTVILMRDIDFYIDVINNKLIFLKNPALYGFSTRLEKVDDSEVLFYKLWLCNCQLDLEWVYKQFGYVVNVYIGKSSENYKNLINAIFDTLILGSNVQSFRVAMASLLDIKLVVDSTETVEDIQAFSDYQVVITNSNVYTFDIDSTVIVSIGDSLQRGDILVDALNFYELSNYDSIEDADITGLFIEPENTKLPINGSLAFTNQDLPSEYSVDDSGFVNVRFPVGGFSDDVEAFWAYVASEGKRTGNSVAKALRLNEGNSNEPFESEIPALVNPMKFLVSNVYKNNSVIIKLVITNSLISSINDLSILRKLVPAHISVIFIIEILLSTEISTDPTELDPTTYKIVDQSDTESYSYSSIIETVKLTQIES